MTGASLSFKTIKLALRGLPSCRIGEQEVEVPETGDCCATTHPREALCLSTHPLHALDHVTSTSMTPALLNPTGAQPKSSCVPSMKTSARITNKMKEKKNVNNVLSPDMLFGRAMDHFVDISSRAEELRLELDEAKVSLASPFVLI